MHAGLVVPIRVFAIATLIAEVVVQAVRKLLMIRHVQDKIQKNNIFIISYYK